VANYAISHLRANILTQNYGIFNKKQYICVIINTTDMADRYIKPETNQGKEYRELLNAVKRGDVTRIKRGVYATDDALASIMIDVDKIVLGGIVCLYSAWSHYRMTTQVPAAHYIAIDRSRKVVVPDFPTIQLVYQRSKILHLGEVRDTIQGFDVSIYNRERCVCDAIKYRNKIGTDVMAEVLNSYLSSDDINIDLLCRYAKELRVHSTLKKYLEIKI
jgi:predicted transcriptional regulator of viral defense system